MPAPRRLTVMMMLGAALYVGPFLAGLARHPAGTILVFGALLALWSVIYQSGSWPRRARELAQPGGPGKNPPPRLRDARYRRHLLPGRDRTVLRRRRASIADGGSAGDTGARPGACGSWCIRRGRPPRWMPSSMMRSASFRGCMSRPTGRIRRRWRKGSPRRISSLPGDAGPEEVVRRHCGSDDLDAALLAAVDRMGIPPPRPARLAAVLLVTDVERGAGLAGRAEASLGVRHRPGRSGSRVPVREPRARALAGDGRTCGATCPYSYDVDQARDGRRSPRDGRAPRTCAIVSTTCRQRTSSTAGRCQRWWAW